MRNTFAWTSKILLLYFYSQQVQCYRDHIKPSEESLGRLAYNEVNQNDNGDPMKCADSNHIAGHANDMEYYIGFGTVEPKRIYESNGIPLFKRGAMERRTRAKIKRMMKRNRLLHNVRTSNKNSSNFEENISRDMPKHSNIGSAYIQGNSMLEKGKANNQYTKSASLGNNKQYAIKNNVHSTKEVVSFSESNSSINRDNELGKSNYKHVIGNVIHSDTINLNKDKGKAYKNSTLREMKKQGKSKHKKVSAENTKAIKEGNKDLKSKHGFISPIKRLIRKKLKSKILSIPENNQYDHVNDRKDEKNDVEGAGDIEVVDMESKKPPVEALSYGLEDHLANLSLINNGFLKAFQKRYFENKLNGTAPKFNSRDYSVVEKSLKGRQNNRSKHNDWKAWAGLNIGDYNEPAIFYTDKEQFDGTDIASQQNHLSKKTGNDFTKNSGNHDSKLHKEISQDVVDKSNILKTNNELHENYKNKRYMISGKLKHKPHTKTINNVKTRDARDTRRDNNKMGIYSSHMLHNDNDMYDYEENYALDDDIYNRHDDVERPSLVYEASEQMNNREKFHRLKKDNSYFKKPHLTKIKNQVDNSELQTLNSRKAHESSYNEGDHEATDSCVGYNEVSLNTTGTTLTMDMTRSTVTTKRNNNGKTKVTKSKKLNVDTKNNTNNTAIIDDHGLFLCGQLANDFVKAVMIKIRRSKKILKELGFSNDTEESCDRCIETKANKLPDLEIMKTTLGKCSASSELKQKNPKCCLVPDPMESFLVSLLSLGKEEEDGVHSRFRDDSSFIFTGDEIESLTQNDNGVALDGKYSDRDTVNKPTFEKHIFKERSDVEKVDNRVTESHQNIFEENNQEDGLKDTPEDVYQSNDDQPEINTKLRKPLENKGLQQDSGNQLPFQSEENLKGNDLIDVFEGQDSLTPFRHKYPSYKEFKIGDENVNQNRNNIKHKIKQNIPDVDYSNEESPFGGPDSNSYDRKNLNYMNEIPSKSVFEQDKQNVHSSNVFGLRQQNYDKGGPQRFSVSGESRKLDRLFGRPERFQENKLNNHEKTSLRGNPPSSFTKTKPFTENTGIDTLADGVLGNNIADIQYPLFPAQSKETGSDISYNAMPFYGDNQRMDKRETPSDTNEEEVVFFELPGIEYDLY